LIGYMRCDEGEDNSIKISIRSGTLWRIKTL
jgi:hypothetical protein